MLGHTQKRVLFDPDIVVLHKVLKHKLGKTYLRKYSLMQGFVEAEYRRKYPITPRRSLPLSILKGMFIDFYSGGTGEPLKQLSISKDILGYIPDSYLSYKIPQLLTVARKSLSTSHTS